MADMATPQASKQKYASYQQNGNVTSYHQNSQCYSPGPMPNLNPTQHYSPPVYSYTAMVNQQSPSLSQGYTCMQGPTVMGPGEQFSALIQRLDNIDTKLTQLEGIQLSVNKITGRLDQMDLRIQNVECKMKGIEESREFDSTSVDEIKQKHIELDSFKAKISEFEHNQNKISQAIQRDITDIKGRSMRDNLLFFGIPEVREKDKRENGSDCVDKVLDIIETHMKIEGAKQDIKLHRAHRIGKYNPQKTRPVVAKFAFYPDRERVRLSANTLERAYGVSQQFPPEVMETLKRLIPIMLEARQQEKEAYISVDKLYINGKLYREPGQTGRAAMN